jgi:hypothetical protein
MEIDITHFFTGDVETWEVSGSNATHGKDAAETTWRAAKALARERPLLATDEQLDAMRAFVRNSGGWDRKEIAAMTPDDLDALLNQWIVGDMRESSLEDSPLEEIDWAAYEVECHDGALPGRIYRGTDGKVYFSLSD